MIKNQGKQGGAKTSERGGKSEGTVILRASKPEKGGQLGSP